MRRHIDMMVQFVFFSPPVDKDNICSTPIMNTEKSHAVAPFCAGQKRKALTCQCFSYLNQASARIFTLIGDAIYF